MVMLEMYFRVSVRNFEVVFVELLSLFVLILCHQRYLFVFVNS